MLSPPKFGSMNGSQMAWKEERIAKLKEINLFKKKKVIKLSITTFNHRSC